MVWDSFSVSTGQARTGHGECWLAGWPLRSGEGPQWHLNVHTMWQASSRSLVFMLGRSAGATQASAAQDWDYLALHTFNATCTQQPLGPDSPEFPFLFRSWVAFNMQEAQAGPMLINQLD